MRIKCLKTQGNRQLPAHTIVGVVAVTVALRLFAVRLIATLRLFPFASPLAVRPDPGAVSESSPFGLERGEISQSRSSVHNERGTEASCCRPSNMQGTWPYSQAEHI